MHSNRYLFAPKVCFGTLCLPKPEPLLIVGPSGVGKGTLVNKLFEHFKEKLKLSVSHTTRKQRQGEQDKIHYNFISQQQFKQVIAQQCKMIQQDELVEYTFIHGNYYGTSKLQLNDIIQSGKIPVLEIDKMGAYNITRAFPNANVCFINAPLEILSQRLLNRRTETLQDVQKRLKVAAEEIKELEQNQSYYQILNDNLQIAVENLVNYVALIYRLDTKNV